jgi:hypothetical protein
MSFTGTWHVISSPDLDDQYLRAEVEPYIKLRQTGDRVEGEYHIGLQPGQIEGRLEGENQIVFYYTSASKVKQSGGAGRATLEGNRLTFVLIHPKGDEFTFECVSANGRE